MKTPQDQNTRKLIKEKAAKAVLRTLIELTKNELPSTYINPTAISSKTPDHNSYGAILPKDIDELLQPYITDGLVKKATIKGIYPNTKNITGYSINHTKIQRLEKMLTD